MKRKAVKYQPIDGNFEFSSLSVNVIWGVKSESYFNTFLTDINVMLAL
jgi:hypothetical protein